MSLHVDHPLFFLNPFFWFFAFFVALLILIFKITMRLICHIEIQGTEYLDQYPGHIQCGWHNCVILFMIASPNFKNHVWMSHPDWYMKYQHILLRWEGGRVILGSSGKGGRKAADAIVDKLKAGKATVIAPDGPFGPPKVLKKGVLYMALKSGRPIIPVLCEADNRAIVRRVWDHKIFPLPFTTIRLKYCEPIFVSNENFAEVSENLPNILSTS